jgi:hypothetical protein
MRLRVLISYYYFKNINLREMLEKYFTEPYPEIFVDSGGFSASTQGVDINIKEYIGWIKQNYKYISVYANLDVIESAEKTLVNQKIMESEGLKPLPVFHTGEDWNYLEDYINEYPYIALGGMVPYIQSLNKLMPWIVKAYKTANKRSVFHGFGATSWKIVNSFPWYSVDSSSWGAGFRYGRVPLFDERVGKFYSIGLGNSKHCKRHGRLIKELGFDPLDFMDRERNDRVKICAISAISYMKAEQYLRNRWGEIHIPGIEKEAGLKQYLANWPPDITSSEGSRFVGGDIQWEAFGGLKLYLSDTYIGNLSDGDAGLKVYLADPTPNVQDFKSAFNYRSEETT